MKPTIQPDIKVGTILIHSIGFGCDSFYQVMKRSQSTVFVKKLDPMVIHRNVKQQTCDYWPIPNQFMADNGSSGHNYTLRLKNHGDIGPCKRLMWWKVWDGQPKNQWSN
jgi:hypothetical protein